MAIRYDDEYRRVDGEWLFSRRRERHWYAADLLERPQQVDFDSWHTSHEAPGAARPRAQPGPPSGTTATRPP